MHDGSNDADSRKHVPFSGFVHMAPHLANPQNPNFGAWIGVFKPSSRNLKTCILSKLLHRFQPNFCTVIKTTKLGKGMAKCPSWVVPTHTSQIQDSGRPTSWKNQTNRHISAMVWTIATKFGTVTQTYDTIR